MYHLGLQGGVRPFDYGGLEIAASLKVKRQILADSAMHLILVDVIVELGKGQCSGFSWNNVYKQITKEPNDDSGTRVVIQPCYGFPK